MIEDLRFLALLKRYVPLVLKSGRLADSSHSALGRDDLEQVARLALWRHLQSEPAGQGGDDAQIVYKVRSAVQAERDATGSTVRLPRSVRQMERNLKLAEETLRHRNRREPKFAEVVASAGLTTHEATWARVWNLQPASLDQEDAKGRPLVDILDDPYAWDEIDSLAGRLEQQRHVNSQLEKMEPDVRNVMERRFGVGARSGMGVQSQSEAGRDLGRSAEWVRLKTRAGESLMRTAGLDRTRRRLTKPTEQELRALIGARDLAWFDLTATDFHGLELSNVDFSHAMLAGSSFVDCELNDSSFDSANLEGATFERVTAHGSDFRFANLTRASFVSSCFRGADMSSSGARYTNVVETELPASLADCDLRYATLRKCSGIGTVLSRSNLTSASIWDCELDGSDLSGITGTNLSVQRTTLTRSILVGADMLGARFGNCDLSRSSLEGARLDQASLADCRLSDARLDSISLSKAHLVRIDLSHLSLRNSIFDRATLDDVDLLFADLSSSLFTPLVTKARLKGASLQGAIVNVGNPSAGCNLRWANLDEATLRGDFGAFDFTGASLRRASLEGGYFSAHFLNADLTDATFSGANCTEALFDGAILYNTNFVRSNVSGINFRRTDLRTLTLRDCTAFRTFADMESHNFLTSVALSNAQC